jgi:hypothetical protein
MRHGIENYLGSVRTLLKLRRVEDLPVHVIPRGLLFILSLRIVLRLIIVWLWGNIKRLAIAAPDYLHTRSFEFNLRNIVILK